MNYYLDYRTSETLNPARSCEGPVSYYLVYGTSETGKHFAAGGDHGELLLGLRYFRNFFSRGQRRFEVNYYLDYRTSETQAEG